jgi:hypothetical protein
MSFYRRSGPSPLLVVLIAALLVFGGYFTWTGFLNFLEDRGDITAHATREAVASGTARAAPPVVFPSPYMPATFTPLPPCQWFSVSAERAVYRECPSKDNQQCPIRETVEFGTQICVYSRVPGNAEWYIIELNPGGSYRDTAYMHESVLKAVNPTSTPRPTVTPGPTVTPMPDLPTRTPAPLPEYSPTPPPFTTPDPTLPNISI